MQKLRLRSLLSRTGLKMRDKTDRGIKVNKKGGEIRNLISCVEKRRGGSEKKSIFFISTG
jgi:hypothetical protein